MINIFRQNPPGDFFNKYYVVDYFIESSTNLKEAAWNLAIGPSFRASFVYNFAQ